MVSNLSKSILHNIGVIFVGFVFAYIGSVIDHVLSLPRFSSEFFGGIGVCLVSVGFSLRVWATYIFYQHKMKVIVLHPQEELITTGPYAFSRNPLYLGGNVFIFFGAACILGSWGAVMLTFVNIFLTNTMIAREEKQLEKKFGKQWILYRKRVRRWI